MKNTAKKTGKNNTQSSISRVMKDRLEYENLCKAFPLRPIRSDKQNDRAADVCDTLTCRLDNLSKAEEDYLDVLSDLIIKYESKWDDGKRLTPAELIQYLIEENNLTQKDLIPQLGSASRVSEFLKGERALSKEQAKRLAKRFCLKIEALI